MEILAVTYAAVFVRLILLFFFSDFRKIEYRLKPPDDKKKAIEEKIKWKVLMLSFCVFWPGLMLVSPLHFFKMVLIGDNISVMMIIYKLGQLIGKFLK
jgi:hypothetical protein